MRDMGAPERVDEGLSIMVAPVLRPRIPDMGMRVDDEDLGAFRRDIHVVLLSSFGRRTVAAAVRTRHRAACMVSDETRAVQPGSQRHRFRKPMSPGLVQRGRSPLVPLPPCMTRQIVGTSASAIYTTWKIPMSLSAIFARLVAWSARSRSSCGTAATVRASPPSAARPPSPPRRRQGIPTLKMPTARGWAAGQTPIAAAGAQGERLRVRPQASALDPRAAEWRRADRRGAEPAGRRRLGVRLRHAQHHEARRRGRRQPEPHHAAARRRRRRRRRNPRDIPRRT